MPQQGCSWWSILGGVFVLESIRALPAPDPSWSACFSYPREEPQPGISSVGLAEDCCWALFKPAKSNKFLSCSRSWICCEQEGLEAVGGCFSTPETGATKFWLGKNVVFGTLSMALKELHFTKASLQCQPGPALSPGASHTAGGCGRTRYLLSVRFAVLRNLLNTDQN